MDTKGHLCVRIFTPSLLVQHELIRMKRGSGSSSDEENLQKYASDLLSESLVTGVPSIVKASNWPKKTFKSCALFLCFAGFTYQTTVFVTFFLEYSSSVDIIVETTEYFVAPAVTICNNNGIERTKFCKKFPERCTVPPDKATFCRNYPENCDRETEEELLLIPKPEYYDYESNATLEEFKELSLEQELFFNVSDIILPVSSGRSSKQVKTDILGPFLLYKQKTLGTVCYSLNSCVKNCNGTKWMKVAGYLGRIGDPKMTITLRFDKSESFLPGRDAGGWLSLHSPFEVSNPSYKGHFIKPDSRYGVIFTAEREENLPSPYRANCRNYTDSWLKNGWTGPTSEVVCKELCDLDVTRHTCGNCSGKLIDYPQDGDVCFTDSSRCPKGYSFEEYDLCVSDCREDCIKYKFPYTVEERPLHENVQLSQPISEIEKTTVVELYLGDTDIVTYRHVPRYQDIEIFSYIGGYIGAWLGISLVAVTDFFESLFYIVMFTFRKRPPKKSGRKEEVFQ